MTVLHVDMDAFFAAVEQRDNPALRGKPVIVGAPPDKRGVVSTCSYEARTFGVHSAMPSREAARLCPQGIFLPGNHAKYAAVSAQVMEILERFTPIIEQVSIDEAYLDVTGSHGLFGDGEAIGRAIRKAIRSELDLAASVGVGPGKLVAKICSELAKPDGMKVAPFAPAELAAFLAPLPAGALPGIGKVARARLESRGVHTIGDLQRIDGELLRGLLGDSFAAYVREAAFGVDEREVAPPGEELTISREYTFGEDCTSREEVRRKLHELCDDVGRRLRAAGKWANLARLKLRWSDFRTITRQRPMSRSVRDDFSLFEEALALFDKERLVAPVRLVGFGVGDLSEAERQPELDLFGDAHGAAATAKKERLSETVDALRRKLGRSAFRRLQ